LSLSRGESYCALCTIVVCEPAGRALQWGNRCAWIGAMVQHEEMLFFGLEFAAMRDIGAARD
jgi:hypothetical protein